MAIILISDSPDTDEAVRLSDITDESCNIYSQSTLAVACVTVEDLRSNLEFKLKGKDLDKLKSLSNKQIFSVLHEIGECGFGTSSTTEMEEAGIEALTNSWLENLAEWEEMQSENEDK